MSSLKIAFGLLSFLQAAAFGAAVAKQEWLWAVCTFVGSVVMVLLLIFDPSSD